MNFSELSERAKTKARNDYTYGDYPVGNWWEFTYEDAIRIGKLLGFDIESKDISFSGFWSQGDGASFSGRFSPNLNCAADVRQEAPLDKELHAIADALTIDITSNVLSGQPVKESDALICRSNSHYCHSGCMTADLFSFEEYGDEWANSLTTLSRRFADWIYARLKSEHNYLTSDEHVDEALADEEFDAEGHSLCFII